LVGIKERRVRQKLPQVVKKRALSCSHSAGYSDRGHLLRNGRATASRWLGSAPPL
jgi:hypothetical protein